MAHYDSFVCTFSVVIICLFLILIVMHFTAVWDLLKGKIGAKMKPGKQEQISVGALILCWRRTKANCWMTNLEEGT